MLQSTPFQLLHFSLLIWYDNKQNARFSTRKTTKKPRYTWRRRFFWTAHLRQDKKKWLQLKMDLRPWRRRRKKEEGSCCGDGASVWCFLVIWLSSSSVGGFLVGLFSNPEKKPSKTLFSLLCLKVCKRIFAIVDWYNRILTRIWVWIKIGGIACGSNLWNDWCCSLTGQQVFPA